MKYINIKTIKESNLEVALFVRKDILYPFDDKREIDSDFVVTLKEDGFDFLERGLSMINNMNNKLIIKYPIFKGIQKVIVSNENIMEILESLQDLCHKNQSRGVFVRKVLVFIEWECNLLSLRDIK